MDDYHRSKVGCIDEQAWKKKKRMHTELEMGIIDEGEKINNVDEGPIHEDPYQFEEAQYLNANMSYTFKLNLNLPTHYTLALKNHENFSYGGGAQQVQRPGQNLQQYHASPGFQQQQQQ